MTSTFLVYEASPNPISEDSPTKSVATLQQLRNTAPVFPSFIYFFILFLYFILFYIILFYCFVLHSPFYAILSVCKSTLETIYQTVLQQNKLFSSLKYNSSLYINSRSLPSHFFFFLFYFFSLPSFIFYYYRLSIQLLVILLVFY
jgi:hypothetical protein